VSLDGSAGATTRKRPDWRSKPACSIRESMRPRQT
jgi:hypothetical protein